MSQRVPSPANRIQIVSQQTLRTRVDRRRMLKAAGIVAVGGIGAPAHPGWYRNLSKDSEVELQVKRERIRGRARTAAGEERERLWRLMAEIWPAYDEYATRTDREIPVVVVEPL